MIFSATYAKINKKALAKGEIIVAYTNSIGIIQNISHFFDDSENDLLDRMVDAGVETLQLLVNNHSYHLMTEENAEKVLKKIDGKLRITSLWGGWHTGPDVWNFIDGPVTLGIVPESYRANRLEELKKDADFARRLGVGNMATHVGFIPENPYSPEYRSLVSAVRYIAEYCDRCGLNFNFETGQETPVTLMRVIGDVGADNLGINLDPANLIMYGKGNPVDAIDIYGDRIRGVHVKDGDYPKGDFYKLGSERVVGEGSVNYPVFLPKLLKSGYSGDLYIEREITGEARARDVEKTVKYIKELMA